MYVGVHDVFARSEEKLQNGTFYVPKYHNLLFGATEFFLSGSLDIVCMCNLYNWDVLLLFN